MPEQSGLETLSLAKEPNIGSPPRYATLRAVFPSIFPSHLPPEFLPMNLRCTDREPLLLLTTRSQPPSSVSCVRTSTQRSNENGMRLWHQ